LAGAGRGFCQQPRAIGVAGVRPRSRTRRGRAARRGRHGQWHLEHCGPVRRLHLHPECREPTGIRQPEQLRRSVLVAAWATRQRDCRPPLRRQRRQRRALQPVSSGGRLQPDSAWFRQCHRGLCLPTTGCGGRPGTGSGFCHSGFYRSRQHRPFVPPGRRRRRSLGFRQLIGGRRPGVLAFARLLWPGRARHQGSRRRSGGFPAGHTGDLYPAGGGPGRQHDCG